MADQGASVASHGRHVVVATCRMATAARRGRCPQARVRARVGRKGGRGLGAWASASARGGGTLAPLPPILFF